MTNDIDTVAERNGRDPANWRFRAENHPRFHADFWRRLHTNDIVFGDSGEDAVKRVEPEPVKRTRKRKPTLAGVARQAARAGIEVAGFEVRPDGVIKIITGKPVGASNTDTDDTTALDRSEWN